MASKHKHCLLPYGKMDEQLKIQQINYCSHIMKFKKAEADQREVMAFSLK